MKTLTTLFAIACFALISNKGISQTSYINTNSITASSIKVNIMTIAVGIVKVKMNSQPTGVYTVQLINAAGKTISTGTIAHEASASAEIMNFGITLTGGAYSIVVTNPDTTTTVQKFILLI